MESERTISEKGTISYHLNGKLHKEDGPAIEFADGGMYLIAEDAVTADLSADNYVWSCRFTDADDYLRSQILNSDFEIVETSVE